jgi:hypothetical protein
MKEKLYFICYKADYLKRGKIAILLDIVLINKMVKCYYVQFDDYSTDYIDIKKIEENDWHMVTLDDLLNVGMPK